MADEEGLKEILARIEPTIKLRKITLAAFLIGVILTLQMGLFAHPEYMLLTVLTLTIWFFSAYIFEFLVKKQKTFSGASNLYFGYSILVEFGLLTIIVFNAGGIEWIGAIFYLFTIIYCNIILSTLKGLITSLVAFIWYGGLVSLQYLGLIPFRPYFDLGVNLHQNPNYVFTTLLFVMSTFLLAGLAANLFTDLLRKRTRELVRAHALEEAKSVLEIKVAVRTRELKELTENLDKQVKQRTQELQEKIEELEKFQKLAVGRELKMIELKKEIKKLKGLLKSK